MFLHSGHWNLKTSSFSSPLPLLITVTILEDEDDKDNLTLLVDDVVFTGDRLLLVVASRIGFISLPPGPKNRRQEKQLVLVVSFEFDKRNMCDGTSGSSVEADNVLGGSGGIS